jgi:hypothetical protein
VIFRRALLAALTLPAAAFAQVLWLKVEGPNRAFIFELPGTPEYKIQDRLHSYSLVRGPMEYVVQGIEIDVPQPRAVVQAALDGAAPSLAGAKWQKIDWRESPGMLVADANGTLKDGNAFRNLVALKGKQLVSMGLRGPAGTTRFPDADRFFNSLRFP